MHTIFITGTNRGIGLEMVQQYLSDGWRVLACCRKPEEAFELQDLSHKTSSGSLEIFALDVSKQADIWALAAQLKSVPIDILVNNASIYGPGKSHICFGRMHPLQAMFSEVMHINAWAPLCIAEAFFPNLLAGKLKILANMSSAVSSISENTTGGGYIYRTSKAALNAITKSLSIDLKAQGIITVALHPGWVMTRMGGGGAILTPKESVNGLRRVLAALSMQDNGRFIRYNGSAIAW